MRIDFNAMEEMTIPGMNGGTGVAVCDGARERQEEIFACRSRVLEHQSPAELFVTGCGALLEYAERVSD